MLRQIAQSAAAAPDANERRIGGIITDHIDDWLSNLSPRDVQVGDQRQAVGLIKDARNLWSRQAKGRVVEDLLLDATGAPKDAADIRRGFSTLFKNKFKMRQFTTEEKRAIALVAAGGSAGKITRALSFLSPRNPVGAVLARVHALPTSGVGSAMTAAGGEAARAIGRATTRHAGDAASALIRNGGVRPFNLATSQSAGGYAEQLLQPVGRAAVPFSFDALRR
jgi:hypothetical protein